MKTRLRTSAFSLSSWLGETAVRSTRTPQASSPLCQSSEGASPPACTGHVRKIAHLSMSFHMETTSCQDRLGTIMRETNEKRDAGFRTLLLDQKAAACQRSHPAKKKQPRLATLFVFENRSFAKTSSGQA
jgi:hypothetical protein